MENQQTVKKYRPFTKDEFIKALKARYRDPIHADDIEGALTDAHAKEQSLKDAVEELVQIYVKEDGDSRFLILTPDEIKQRDENAAKIAFVRALIDRMRKGPATSPELKTAVRYQATMRKLTTLDTDALSSDIVAILNSEKLVKMGRGGTWELCVRAGKALAENLKGDDFLKFCPNALSDYPVREFRPRPRYEMRDGGRDYTLHSSYQ